MLRELAGQHQEPRPSVRALEIALQRLFQVAEFAGDICRRQVLIKQRVDIRRLGQLGKQS